MTPEPTGTTGPDHRRDRVATMKPLNDTADTVLAMTLLWAIPVLALLLTLTRM